MKTVSLSIGEFALPVPRKGSIETHSGFGSRSAAQGREIHELVQAKRARAHDEYEAEVPISHVFERDGYRFEVGGRMDGFFKGTPPRIEEIKSGFNLWELSKKLRDGASEHPYCLQLRTYGYFYWLQNQVEPELNFHLVSSRSTSTTDDLPLRLDLKDYERWLELRLAELVIEAQQAEERAARRRKIAEKIEFPFESPRPGQVDLIATIEEGMHEGKRMLIQAPTGLGKTVGVLYPSLKEALARGQGVVYVTPKNSQHSVAEEAVERFQDQGAKLKPLTLTAKSKICFKPEPLCNPEYCEFARDYYTKVAEKGLIEAAAKKKKLNSKVFTKLGEEHEVCPFELQLDVAHEADVIIGDYNYVFGPRSALGILAQERLDQEGSPNLVIDEAHNLPARAIDYFSPALSSLALDRMREDVRELPQRFAQEAELLLDACIQVIVDARPEGATKPMRFDPEVDDFLEQDSKLRAFLSRYLESDVEIKPRDVVLRLCFYWQEFTAALEFATDPTRDEFFTTFQPHPSGGTVKITCCDASQLLKERYDSYQNVVAFSATLKPFEYFARLSGLEGKDLKTAEFSSPFPRENRKLLIIPQISTKYSDRERNYPRIAEVIRRVTALKPGNYFAFFPSFEFMERTLERFEPPPGFTILRQERDMKGSLVESVVDHLRSSFVPTLVFAVQGGVFSEGVDYPGDALIGAFVVGPPLPNFDLEREGMRDYYEKRFKAGFDYAYTYPAMAKAVQAAGRVIRSEKDRGLIVLLDSRFVQAGYAASMPGDWFVSSPRELVPTSILAEVAEFWKTTGNRDSTEQE